MARLASLTVDTSAPTELSSEQKAALAVHPRVIKLGQRNRALTGRIRRAGYRSVDNARGTVLYQKKKKAEAQLNTKKKSLRSKIIAQARKRHFRMADTLAFDTQFSTTGVPSTSTAYTERTRPIVYNIPERARMIQLVCNAEVLSDNERFRRRIQAIETRTALCHRREAQRRDRPRAVIKREESDDTTMDLHAGVESPELICRPTQCLFCLGDKSLPHHYRFYEYSRPYQMMNEVDNHLRSLDPAHPVSCPHPGYRREGIVLPSVMVFKNHVARVHNIILRE